MVEVPCEQVVAIRCDVCNKSIVESEHTEVASILKFSGGPGVFHNKFEDYEECENTDLCRKCYDKVLDFLRPQSEGRELPGYVTTAADEDFNDMMDEVAMFEPEDGDDDPKLN